RLWSGLAVPNRALAIACAPLPRLGASCDDEARRALRRHSEGEGVKRRRRRRADLRTYVAARDRIDLAVEQAPFLQRDDVDFVEGAKPLLGERSRRAQLAGAERRQRPARLGDQALDTLEALLQRHWASELHALHGVTRQRRN